MTSLEIINISNNLPLKTAVTNVKFCGTNIADKIPRDTVDIDVEKKRKKNNNTVLGLIIGSLSIAGAILAYIKCHKPSSVKKVEELSPQLKEIQQIYKDIFRRNISAEETKDFAKRYKTIIDSKTSDNDREYCEKLLDEISKDRQTKRPEILRWIENSADADPKCLNGGMATAPDGTYIDIYMFNYRNNSRIPNKDKGLFESLFHETHHVKQDEIIYRTDREFFLNHLINKFIDNGNGEMYKEILRQNKGDKNKTFNEIKQAISEQIDNYWGSFKPFANDSPEYQEGLKLIEGKRKYKFMGNCRSHEEYKNQTIEKGAYSDGEKAEKLFDILKSLNI